MTNSLQIQKKQLPTILLHVCAWALIFFFPLFIADFGEDLERYNRFVRRSILGLSTHLLVFYVNYALLMPKLLSSKKYWPYILINIVLITIVVVISRYLYECFVIPATTAESHKPRFPKEVFYFWDALSYLTNIGVAIALLATNRLAKEQEKVKNIENERLKSELIYLKYQLQPHFFFNTLNNIYALIDAFPEKAKDTILKLSKLMRYVLYQSDDKNVPLQDEIEFLKNYAELMRIRFAGHVDIQTNFQDSGSGAKLPPLLLVPLIENAFKHGVDAMQQSFIHIELKEIDGWIELFVKNSYFPKSESDESGSGIGLDNLNKRLELLLSAEEYSLDQKIIDKSFQSHLKIKLQYG